MFVREDYKDRALGLAGALGLLIVAILVNRGAPAVVKVDDATHAVNHVLEKQHRREFAC